MNKACGLTQVVYDVASEYKNAGNSRVSLESLSKLEKHRKQFDCVKVRKTVLAFAIPFLCAALGAVLGFLLGFTIGAISGPGVLLAAAVAAIIGAKKFWMIGACGASLILSALPTVWQQRKYMSSSQIHEAQLKFEEATGQYES